jgi:hypothetical protein
MLTILTLYRYTQHLAAMGNATAERREFEGLEQRRMAAAELLKQGDR